MYKNRIIRKELIDLYGSECFIEKLHIRPTKNIKYKGKKQHSKMQRLTLHHIKMKCEGGETSVENGALLNAENHEWFHKQDRETQDMLNKMFVKYKKFADFLRGREIPVVEDDIDPEIKVNAMIFETKEIKKQRDNLVNTIDMLIESGVPISHIVIANKNGLKEHYRDRIDKLEQENKELKEKIKEKEEER